MALPILSSRIRPASLHSGARLARHLPTRFVPMAMLALLGFSGIAQGESYTWGPTGSGVFSWNNALGESNWGPGSLFPNAAGDAANLTSNITADSTVELNQLITLGVLNIGDTNNTHAFTITAGTAGSFLFNNLGAPAEIHQLGTSFGDTIAANVATVGDLNISNSAAGSLVFTGALTSAATSGTQNVTNSTGNVRFAGDIGDGTSGGRIALVQSGTGYLSLQGNNTFSGGVTLNSGTLVVGSATAFGATSSALTINGGTLSATGAAPITLTNNNAQVWGGNFTFSGATDLHLGNGAVTLTGNRTVSVTASILTVGGVISDGGNGYSLSKASGGTLSLTNANTYSGMTTVSGGRLDIQHGGALGTGLNVAVTGGGTLQLQGGITVTGKALSLSGEGVGNAGTLRNIAGNNTWTGNISANTASIVRIASESGLFTINGDVVTSGAEQFVLQGFGDGVINGIISGDGRLTKSTSGTGTWTLTGNNTYTGSTTISNGTLQIGNGGPTGTLGTAGVSIATTGTLIFNRSNDLTVTNAISGSGALIKKGAGNLTLGSSNSFNGSTAIEAGTLTLGHASALGGSTLNYNGQGGVLSFGALTAATLGNLSGSQNLALANANAEAVTLTVGANNQSQTYTGVLSGAGGLTKGGSGTLTLTGVNTYTGTTTVTNGTLQIGDGGTTGTLTPGDVTMTGSGTFAINRSDDLTLTKVLTGTGSFAKMGTGNLTIDVDQTYTGNTSVAGGTLILGTPTAISSSTLNYDNQGGVISFAGHTAVTIGNLRGGQNLTLTNANAEAIALTVGGNNQSQTYAGALTGPGSIIKTGTGTLSLTGSNVHTGGTTVSAGTLSIGNGGYSGNLTGNVVNDATLRFNRTDSSSYGGQISGTGSLVKLGSGTLTLTGSSTYTGTTTVSNGTLLLDYSNSSTVLPSGSPLTLGPGTLYIKGASTGTTAQTLGDFVTASSLGSKIVVDSNGGEGTTLTLGNNWTFGGSNGLHFDLSRGGKVLSSPTLSSGVIVANGTVARATVTGIDGRTYFATVTDGAIAPQTALTALTPNSNNTSTNFNVSGHIVTTSVINTATLRIDTTQTDGSLDISGGNLNYARTSFLMDGEHDFEIKRTSGTGTVSNVVIHQYGTGALTISAPFGAGFTKTGGGLMIGAMQSGSPSSITLTDGIYRMATPAAMPSGGTNIAGGILELGNADLTAALGTAAGQVRVTADGGFSAYGATRAVKIVNSNSELVSVLWDNSNFLPNNSSFVLSSPKSNATLDFQSPISLGALTRTVSVHDGSAAVDAQLSGALTGTDRFVKTGPGTLALTGVSTGFTGTATVAEGTLAVNGSIAGSVNVTRGILQGHGDGLSSGLIGGGVTVGDNAGIADAILSPGNGIGSLTTSGALSLNSDAQFKFELNSSASLADKMTATGISITSGAAFVALDLALTSIPLALNTTFVVLNNTSLDPISGAFANLPNGGLLAVGANIFQANYNGGTGNDLTLVVVPEPGTGALLLAGLGTVLGLRPNRRRARRA